MNERIHKYPHAGLILAVLACAQAMVGVDISIVFIALPSIGNSLGFTAHDLQWVVSAYALTFGGFLLLGGRMADLIGRKRLFIFALTLFGLSSLFGGLAHSQQILIIARAIQGLGGAILFPANLSLVNTLFKEGRERNRALAVWSTTGGSGLVFGTLLGGLLTNLLGWEWTFFVNVPIVLLLILGAATLMPAEAKNTFSLRQFDIPGALSATAASLLLVYGLTEGSSAGWASLSTIATILGSLLLFILFIIIEARSRTPLMPLHIFRNRTLVASMLITAIYMGTYGVQPYLITVWLQQVHHYNALEAGFVSLPLALAVMVSTNLGGRWTTRWGLRTSLIAGLAIGICGFVLFAFILSPDRSYFSDIIPWGIIAGLGQGITWTAMWIAAATGIPAHEQGIASGIASTTQQVGNAIGLAVFEAIAHAGVAGLVEAEKAQALNHGLQNAFWIAALIMLGGILVAALALRKSSSQQPESLTIPEVPLPEHRGAH